MDFGGFIERFADEKIGALLGAGATMQLYGGIGNTITGQIQAAATDFHMPNMSHVMAALGSPIEGQVFKPALAIGIIGYILEEIDGIPQLTQIGRLMAKLGTGMAIGVLAEVMVDYSTRGHSPTPEEIARGVRDVNPRPDPARLSSYGLAVNPYN